MSTAPTPARGSLAAVLIALVLLFALFGAGAAAVLLLGTAARIEPVAVEEAR